MMVEYGNQAFVATTSLKSVGRKEEASGCGHRLGGGALCGCVVREIQSRQKNTQTSLG